MLLRFPLLLWLFRLLAPNPRPIPPEAVRSSSQALWRFPAPHYPNEPKTSSRPSWRCLAGLLELPSPPPAPFFFAKPLVRLSAGRELGYGALPLPHLALWL